MIPVTPQLRIAVAAEYKKRATDVETTEKAAFLKSNPAGTRLIVVDDEGTTLGAVAIAKGSKGSATYTIDEELALPWALHEFGEGVVETITRLTSQGRLSVIQAAKDAHAKGEELPPGVTRGEPTAGNPSVSWTSNKEVDAGALIASMAQRGVLPLGEILAVEQ